VSVKTTIFQLSYLIHHESYVILAIYSIFEKKKAPLSTATVIKCTYWNIWAGGFPCRVRDKRELVIVSCRSI
jgi:hypothetical protein